ncbi:MAG: tRNA (adenosine(37)-N6)-threonylcarbamoyltransferase complex dimerization subunit type 1 TsaB [Deltaproteobacteria bacterium]|nr:tRNA (adenosine(37)-N6)-threonylcarbamoyltransferase complex dimerization subunit type 1 TsaB [Deltaproteobacteria bacterium]MCL6120610.1 tRNA (adenosine(37)-N6)-threonylcarbamoyltransferase complex dimerization subunit type 1 TsaB [Deltaproteobacteria bacterium]
MFLSMDSSNGYSNLLAADENFNILSESISDFHEKHSVLIFKQLDEIIYNVGIKLTDFKGIAVILGPGSYTGIRVSLTIAKTLSYVLKTAVVGLGSLSVCAYRAAKENSGLKNIVAVCYASKDRYYVSEFSSETKYFEGQIKTDILNLEELRLFLNDMKDKPLLVYGFNNKNDCHFIEDKLKDAVAGLLFLDLKDTAYFAAKYAIESYKINGGSVFNEQYSEEISPYYVYGNGPF